MLKTGYSLGLIKPIEHVFKPGLGRPNFASLIQVNPNGDKIRLVNRDFQPKEDNKSI